MLRLSRDRVRIGLTPEQVSGVRIARSLRPQVTEKHAVPCPQDAGPPAWRGALAGLAELLPRLKPAPADVALIVSSRFVRYALVPWSANLGNPREELAYARHRFTEIHGEEAERWDIRLSPGGAGEARIASALDPDLLDALRTVFRNTPLRLDSIQPYLMAAYNLWRRSLVSGDGLFLVAENRLYTGAAFHGGQWSAVHTGTIHGDLADELPIILDRECVWADFSERPSVFLHAPEQPGFSPQPGASWTVNALRLRAQAGFSPFSDAQVGMAMSVE